MWQYFPLRTKKFVQMQPRSLANAEISALLVAAGAEALSAFGL